LEAAEVEWWYVPKYGSLVFFTIPEGLREPNSYILLIDKVQKYMSATITNCSKFITVIITYVSRYSSGCSSSSTLIL
jgi:hypothetical protein